MFFGEEDSDFCSRVIGDRFSILYIPGVVVYHKVGAAKNSRLSDQLNLYHCESKIYNMAKNGSGFLSPFYFLGFLSYQVLSSFREARGAGYSFRLALGISRKFSVGIANRFLGLRVGMEVRSERSRFAG